MKIIAAILITMSGFMLSAGGAPAGPDYSLLKEGDIVFQETRSGQAGAIMLATHSRYTHAGILIKTGGMLWVLEAVQPVRITGLDAFISRGTGRHFVVKRLINREAVISDAVIARMGAEGRSHLGKNYDIYFGWSDDRLYCTELIWKIYKRAAGVEVGRLQKLKEFDLSHPYVRGLMKKRYGSSIPYNEPVISPQAMFEAGNLVTVLENQ